MKEGDEEAAAAALAAAQAAAAAAADAEGADEEARSAAVAAAAASSKPAAIMLRLLRKRLDKGGGSATYGSIARDTKRGDKRRRNVAAGFFQLLQVCVHCYCLLMLLAIICNFNHWQLCSVPCYF
jgi:hypothetical protein